MRITKAVAAIQPGTDDTDSPNGSFEAILSAPTLDRDGDTFATSEWKTPLPDHITIDIDHGMKVSSTVGSAQPFMDEDGSLRIRGTFASTDLGQQVRTLVNEGHIRTMSVAALESRTKSADGDDAVSRELLNGAFVAVPSNRDAVVLSSKALDYVTRDDFLSSEQVKQMGWPIVDAIRKAAATAPDEDDDPAPGTAKHDDMVQAVHDASVVLGADCVPGDDLADGAAEGANKSLAPEVSASPDIAVVKAKAISGSIDDMTARISDAVCALARGTNEYAYIRTLFLDSATSGTVVYDYEGETGCQTFSRSFSFDGTSVTLGDTATPVEMVTSVQPVPTPPNPAPAAAIRSAANAAADDVSERLGAALTTFRTKLDAVLKTSDADSAGERDESTPDEATEDSAASKSVPPQGRTDDGPAEHDVDTSADEDIAALKARALKMRIAATTTTKE